MSIQVVTAFSGDYAEFSDCGTYRYLLTRGAGSPVGSILGVIMLNPSTADAFKDDPTIRRVRAFAALWGHGLVLIGNLYGYRSPHPRDLVTSEDPVGPRNNEYLKDIIVRSSRVLVAWGTNPLAVDRARLVVEMAVEFAKPLWCLGTTSNGSPIHPLARGKHRVPDTAQPVRWEAA